MPYSKAIGFAFFLLFLSSRTIGQVNRYMVFFKDKSESQFNTETPQVFLSQKSIERRIRQNIQVSEEDFPVNQNYIQGLRDAGVPVFFKSRWMNGVLVQCDASLLSTIQSLTFVKSVEYVAPGLQLTNGRRKNISKHEDEDSTHTATSVQLSMIGVDSMHKQGYHGEGITIAVLDSGFPGVNTHDAFYDLINDGRIDINTSYDFIFNTNNVFQYDSHGTKVLSIIGGYKSNTFTGSAYKANFQLYVTEDVPSEYRIEEYNWLFAAERADSAGADIITSSLGYNTFDDATMNYKKTDLDGSTAVITRAAQLASNRGILVISSAGNEGNSSWQLITPPADCKDVLAIANVDSNGIRHKTSSVGSPDYDVIKPDLTAQGTNVSIIENNGTVSSGSGTSFAAPLIAGLAAGLWQKHPQLSNAEIRDALKQTASQSNHPDSLLGYGIPNFNAVENFLANDSNQPVFVVYPNPINTIIHVRPRDPSEITSCRLELLNTQGQVVDTSIIPFSWLVPSYVADLSALSSGMYFMRIFYGNEIYMTKIIKQ